MVGVAGEYWRGRLGGLKGGRGRTGQHGEGFSQRPERAFTGNLFAGQAVHKKVAARTRKSRAGRRGPASVGHCGYGEADGDPLQAAGAVPEDGQAEED